ncbi:MAG: HD domain-containing protein [Alphaproteobacteria bacterium]
MTKAQRIRDPVYNLVPFGTGLLERTLWDVIQTGPFQRLRRIRQLGFSEFVFSGATHTRFAHSIGVFHTARQLMGIIERHTGEDFRPRQAECALAAALVHDIGHGMFSHSFEEIGRSLNLPLARHEAVSEILIRDSEVSDVFRGFDKNFAEDVADIIKRKEPLTLYDSVVSSQFDADRLDYMQRDRLMTGVQSSGIDVVWLLANLEVGSVPVTADDETTPRTVDTLVLGPKAFHAAESYVLSLLQLYPNVYLHKTTRGAEKIFTCLMIRLFDLVRRRHGGKVGLPKNHPIRRFADEPTSLRYVLDLDDFVFWGALPMMADARDPLIAACAEQLHRRRLPKCIDVRRHLDEADPLRPGMSPSDLQARRARISLACKEVAKEIREKARLKKPSEPQILVDEARRSPYKRYQESRSLLNQILIKHGEGHFEDMADLSAVVASAETFETCRAYYNADDTDGRDMLENIVRTKSGEING